MPDQTIQTKQTPKRYQCRHVFTEGRRYGSPCLHGENFCYYHHKARRAAEMRIRDAGDREGPFELPSLEDRTGIAAPGEVIDQSEEEPEEEVSAEIKTEPEQENRRPRSIAELKDGYYRALDRINRQSSQSQNRTPRLRDGLFAVADEPKQNPPRSLKPQPAILPKLHACQSSTEELPGLSTRQSFHSTLFHCHSVAKRRNLLFLPLPDYPSSKNESAPNAAKDPAFRGASAIHNRIFRG